jgi:hypothetical protein
VTDEDIQGRIKGLIEQEHELRRRLGAGEITAEQEHADLARIESELDQCWDLLRQRRARREYGQDAEGASAREAGVVEGYRG